MSEKFYKILFFIVLAFVFIIGVYTGYTLGSPEPSGNEDNSSTIAKIIELTRADVVRERTQLIAERSDAERQRKLLERERELLTAERERFDKERNLIITDREDIKRLEYLVDDSIKKTKPP